MLAGAAVAALDGGRSPLEAVAAPIMERTPADLANALLEVLGPFARPFAAWGAAALLLLAGGLLGAGLWRLPRRTWPIAPAVGGALGMGGGLSLAGTADPASVAGAAVTYGVGLAWLARRSRRPEPGAAGGDRRAWLLRSVRTVGVVAVASLLPLAGATFRAARGVRASSARRAASGRADRSSRSFRPRRGSRASTWPG
jgi:hypothetical protein